ncbi:GNAT family N-acetyltransferase [Dongia soli]|uniref:GNAT family N-acetyltransferase n=1 Tax=Dongia soli TaxID=600628 RepID=A0ABU5EBE9_9PROT|nr:GNAT family N-acetyltransferase [Dongia soli]MDY0883607.1 GNAT family N-acetyltransferase [Dongia soli]
MESVEIKTIEPRDFDIWLPLWRSYQQFYEVDIPHAVTLKTWERLLDPAEPMHAILAMVDTRALGLAHLIYHRSTWTMGDYCYLQDLFVEPGARGFGIGRALIEHVYGDAKSRGAPRVYWSTHKTNHNAKKFYNSIADRSDFILYRKIIG